MLNAYSKSLPTNQGVASAVVELRLKITAEHSSHFLSPVRCPGSVRPNPIAHVARRSALCDGVPLPVSPGWQIISGSGDGFWSTPRSPWIPLSQLIPLRRRLRENRELESRALTPHIHISAATRAEVVAHCMRLHLPARMGCSFTKHSFGLCLFFFFFLHFFFHPPVEGGRSLWCRVESQCA